MCGKVHKRERSGSMGWERRMRDGAMVDIENAQGRGKDKENIDF